MKVIPIPSEQIEIMSQIIPMETVAVMGTIVMAIVKVFQKLFLSMDLLEEY